MLLIRKRTATQRQWVPHTSAWGTEVERLCVFGSEIRRFLTLKLTEISPNGTTGSSPQMAHRVPLLQVTHPPEESPNLGSNSPQLYLNLYLGRSARFMEGSSYCLHFKSISEIPERLVLSLNPLTEK